MISEGFYDARPVMGVLSSTKSGKPQVAMEFMVDDGQTDHRMTSYLSLVGGAVPITMKILLDCGYEGADLEPEMKFPADAKVRVKIVHEMKDGKTYANIAGVWPAGGMAVQKMEVGEAARIREQCRGHLAKLRADRGASAGRSEAPHPADGDEPF